LFYKPQFSRLSGERGGVSGVYLEVRACANLEEGYVMAVKGDFQIVYASAEGLGIKY